jgi:hypothetical protein
MSASVVLIGITLNFEPFAALSNNTEELAVLLG